MHENDHFLTAEIGGFFFQFIFTHFLKNISLEFLNMWAVRSGLHIWHYIYIIGEQLPVYVYFFLSFMIMGKSEWQREWLLLKKWPVSLGSATWFHH